MTNPVCPRLLVFPVALVLAFAVGAFGCGDAQQARAKACEAKASEMEDAEACKKCCEDAGASGHSYINLGEAECKCL